MSKEIKPKRRDFLFTATYTIGAVGLGAAIWPLVDQMNPDASVKAVSTTEVDAGLPASKQSPKPAAWIITIAWLFFGIGPRAVIGNDIFGSPNDITTWTFGIPAIWAWQILFWLLGTGMMWFLAYKMEMSTMPRKNVSALVDDIGDSARA